jgi:CrcB protein
VPDRSIPRLSDLALVAGGGAVGTAVRFGLSEAVPSSAAPFAILAINVVGAFALGALLQLVSHRPGPRSTRLRLLLGTGVLGGFTTYSSLAVDTVALSGTPLLAVMYAGGTLVAGLLAAAAGIGAVRRRR